MPTTPPAGSALYRLFADQAARSAEGQAVRDEYGTVLTYRELASRAEALAAAVRDRCPGTGRRVGLHLGRTADLVTAVLAVVAAGHVYVPLDPAYPEDRLRFMAEDSDLALVLSDREPSGALDGVQVLRVDGFDWTRTADGAGSDGAGSDGTGSGGDSGGVPGAAPAETPEDAIAYVIYTSGSTGRPKGVEVRGRSVVAMVESVRASHDFTERDVWTLFHSYCFDFSVWEMWGAMATGACLVVVPAATAQSPRACAELLVREGVTVMSVVPTVFRYLVAALRGVPAAGVALRRVIFGGEAVVPSDIRAYRELLGNGCEFVNTYGITETTVFVSTRTLSDAELDRPGGGDRFATELGRPLDGWEVQVLDEDGLPVPVGGCGEINVAGAGVAVGYLGLPDRTEECFRLLALPGRRPERYYRSGDLATRTAEDVYCYAGRVDDQVKINGFRIEPGEVEAVLRGIPDVADAAVVPTLSRTGGRMLTAFYTAGSAVPAVPAEELQRRARRLLPGHLVPGRFVRLPELPRNPSGKTDRRALRSLGEG
ncbi:amino acid adenylation domain-containing protein [Kitasatospora sp. NPDC048239]|uniref:amino acid adenylation domain-containing protein n=1 Tax=Kitasatospora sp. NPDC048239 TaxID=3364046 RepID=UPI00371B965A